MLLEVKEYTIPEIIEWFGVSRPTWYAKKNYYLDELHTYCMYSYINRNSGKNQRIIVEYIYEENAREYVKRNKKKDKVIEKIKEKFLDIWKTTSAEKDYVFETREDNTYLNTVSIVINEIIKENPYLLELYAKSTLYSIALSIRKEFFGIPFKQYWDEKEEIMKSEGESGTKGSCKKTIAIKKEDGRLRYLTGEEKEIVRETAKRIFGEKQIADCTSTVAWVKKLQKEGKITKEEGFDMITSQTEFNNNFYAELKKLGIWMIVATEATIWNKQDNEWITLVDVTDAEKEICGNAI